MHLRVGCPGYDFFTTASVRWLVMVAGFTNAELRQQVHGDFSSIPQTGKLNALM